MGFADDSRKSLGKTCWQ
ncbi:hypothetical protein HaLaN_29549, partial [Haematococcus lacustris]